MPLAEYIRQQAATCLRLSRATFDLSTAEHLRHMAASLNTKADEMENDKALRQLHMLQGHGSFSHSGSNGSGPNGNGHA